MHDGRVRDQLAVLPRQGVHAAERVLPVVIVELAAREGKVEQAPRGLEGRGVKVGGVGRAHLGHGPDPPTMPRGRLLE